MDPRVWLLRHYETLGLITEKERIALNWTGSLADAVSSTTADTKTDVAPAILALLTPEERVLWKFLHVMPYAQWFCCQLIALRRTYLATVKDRIANWPESCKIRAAKKSRLGHELFMTALCKTAIDLQYPSHAQRDRPVVWHGLLHRYRQELLLLSYWRSLESRDDPIVLILSKSLPQRCQIREMAETILDRFASHPEFEHSFRQWTDCSLLGLYLHSRSSPSIIRRLEFFDLTLTPERHALFHSWLLKRQDLLCNFITREYFTYLLPEQPALLEAIRRTFCWEKFEDISIQVMSDLGWLVDRYGWAVMFLGDKSIPKDLACPPSSVDGIRQSNDQANANDNNDEDADDEYESPNGSGKRAKRKRKQKQSSKSNGKAPAKKRARKTKHDDNAEQGAESDKKDVANEEPSDKDQIMAVGLETQGETQTQVDVVDMDTDEQSKTETPSMPEWSLVLADRNGDLKKAAEAHTKLRGMLKMLHPKWLRHGHKWIPRNYERMVEFLAAGSEAEEKQVMNNWKSDRKETKKQHKKASEDLLLLVKAQESTQEFFYFRNQAAFMELIHASRNKVPATTPEPLPGLEDAEMTDRGTTKRHFLTLSSWIDRLDASDPQCEEKALDLLLAFGMPEQALKKVRDLKTAYESRMCGRKTVVSVLRALKFQYPYSYALLHSFSYLFNRHMECRLFRLSAHYLENQVAAIRGRFNLKPEDPIPECAIYCVVCLICDCVYSLYNDTNKKRVRNPRECFGYNYITVDVNTGKKYCTREGVIAHANFKSVELSQFLLLGNVLQFRRQLYTICPQPNCGMVCTIDPQQLINNEYGIGCMYCTMMARGEKLPRRKGKKRAAAMED